MIVLSSFAFRTKNKALVTFLQLVFVGYLAVYQQPVFAQKADRTTIQQQINRTTGREDRPVAPVKNVILMIPDGCSLATMAAARWYNWLLHPDQPALFIDPFICGTVRTFSSNAPIGDSAPTTSCYMTGQPSRTGFVSTYPEPDPINDILLMDSSRAYQPMITVLEASRLVHKKSTGLVFTCEFPHATPADCSSHAYDRDDYTSIVSQMIHNQLDVVIGGGVGLLKPSYQQYLTDNGYTVQTNDLHALKAFNGKRLWSLFGKEDIPYDLDRKPEVDPALDEMTNKAITLLSKNKKGFFLMVEGSKVDWAAHANDAVGMVSEFIAFDKACKVALDFARKDGNTAVVILSDHGNSGISIGVGRMTGYDTLTKNQLFGPLLRYKCTADGLAKQLNAAKREEANAIVFEQTGLTLTPEQFRLLDLTKDYVHSPIPAKQRIRGITMHYFLAKIMSDKTGIGFTTNGHTGEDVMLAVYHPKGTRPMGVRLNVEINDYLCDLLSLKGRLPELTDAYFTKHTEVFKGMSFTIQNKNTPHPVLVVENNGKTLKVNDDSNIIEFNGKIQSISTVAVYVDKTHTFYLPNHLADLLK